MSNRIFSILMLSVLTFTSLPAFAQDTNTVLDPNNIISDADMLDTKSMSVSEIQQFLVSQNSYLATYKTTNAYGTPNKSVAEIIYDAANNNYDCDEADLSDNPTELERQQKCKHITTISPKVILVTIEKESSLIKSHDQDNINNIEKWALGYGCPDSVKGCDNRWKGLGKQINSTALQFLSYMQENNRYPVKFCQTYIAEDEYGLLVSTDPDYYLSTSVTEARYNKAIASPNKVTVTPMTLATAALYNFTPHIRNGNYNFFNFFRNYFPKTARNYPNGSLLQVSGEAGVWLIENGQKRPFSSYSALTSRFDTKKIISVDSSALASYPKGDPIKFANYSLVQIPTGGIYLLVNSEKRPITSKDIFKKIGFNPDEIITATATELDSYTTGATITATSTYPTGKLLQDPKSGGVFYVESGYKYPVTDKILLNTKFKGKKIVKGTTAELNKYIKGAPVLFGDGELLMSSSVPTVYLISGGQKRPFSTGDVFLKLGYKFTNIVTVSPQLLAQYPIGDPVTIQTVTN